MFGGFGLAEEVGGRGLLRQVAEQEVGLPLQLLLGAPRPPQAPDTDDGEQLFEADAGAPNEVFEVAVGAGMVAFSFDADGGFTLHALDEVEAEGEGLRGGVVSGEVAAGVDAGRGDPAAQQPGFVDVEFGPVEAAEVVDAGGHVFQRPVRLEEEALVALDGEGGRVALGKGVSGEALDLPPHLGDHVGCVALVGGLVEEGLAGLLELFARPEFARHPPPQDVGLPEVEPGEPVSHLDHVFLVDHDAIGLRHDLQQDGVGVTTPLGEAVPLDVGLHHAAARHARSDDGTGGDEAEVVVDPQLAHEHPHGGRLHVEAPDGSGFPQ